jgi:hypothetical protein
MIVTIAPSLRDKSYQPIEEPRIKLALMGPGNHPPRAGSASHEPKVS